MENNFSYFPPNNPLFEITKDKEKELENADQMIEDYKKLNDSWKNLFFRITQVRYEINEILAQHCGPEQKREIIDNVIQALRIVSIFEGKVIFLSPKYIFNYYNEKFALEAFEKEFVKFSIDFHNHFLLDEQGKCSHSRMPCPINGDIQIRRSG